MMQKTFSITENELNHIIKMVERIDEETSRMIDRGFPKEIEEFEMDRLDSINVCNFTIGKMFGIYE